MIFLHFFCIAPFYGLSDPSKLSCYYQTLCRINLTIFSSDSTKSVMWSVQQLSLLFGYMELDAKLDTFVPVLSWLPRLCLLLFSWPKTNGTAMSFLSPNQWYQSTEGNKAPTSTRSLASSFLYPPPDSWQKGDSCLYMPAVQCWYQFVSVCDHVWMLPSWAEWWRRMPKRDRQPLKHWHFLLLPGH